MKHYSFITKIKQYPKKFLLAFGASIAYLMVYRVWEIDDWRLFLLMLVLYFAFIWVIFSRSVDDDELTEALDAETKKLDVPIERLYQITGRNRYEVYVNEKGQYIYWISDDKKKALLKRLKELNQ
ncbi:hypothetical protein [Macrococcus brunensis]|uniref:hypothetical protein n=1 Tax=Macrococcus brunensis TaxID=198483 RepID=UPI001EF0E2BA|nr:hypothetical protein [Macrococcus brunensis]ULG71989.1 hypothetical protein MGG12_00230 [Macrococcus brunensis]